MKLAACVHSVVDPEARLRLDGHGGIAFGESARMIDPVDAAALEVAVQLAERSNGEVTAFLAGPPSDEDVLRTSLSHGANAAIRIDADRPASGRVAGGWLADAITAGELPALVLCGAGSSDHRTGATPATLARRLGWPVIYHVVAIEPLDEARVRVQRRRDGGYREDVEVSLPAVLAVDRGVATPRFPTTQARLRARRAAIETRRPAAGGNGVAEDLGYVTPPPRRHGIAWPGAELDARARLKFLVQGGVVRSGGGGPVTGSPDDVAEAIARFLRERGIIRAS